MMHHTICVPSSTTVSSPFRFDSRLPLLNRSAETDFYSLLGFGCFGVIEVYCSLGLFPTESLRHSGGGVDRKTGRGTPLLRTRSREVPTFCRPRTGCHPSWRVGWEKVVLPFGKTFGGGPKRNTEFPVLTQCTSTSLDSWPFLSWKDCRHPTLTPDSDRRGLVYPYVSSHLRIRFTSKTIFSSPVTFQCPFRWVPYTTSVISL